MVANQVRLDSPSQVRRNIKLHPWVLVKQTNSYGEVGSCTILERTITTYCSLQFIDGCFIWQRIATPSAEQDWILVYPSHPPHCPPLRCPEEPQIRSAALHASCCMVQQPEQETTGDQFVMPRWSITLYAENCFTR